MYMGFNSAAGLNADNVEADNKVTIVTKAGARYGESYLRAHLLLGEAYYHNGAGIVMSAQCVSTAATPLVVCVYVRLYFQACPPCACNGGTPTGLRCNTSKRFTLGAGYSQWISYIDQGGEHGRELCHSHFNEGADAPHGWWYQY